MSVKNCLVDEYRYDVGCLAPAILIIAILSFMRKRVQLKPDLWDGRPGLPVPVDFLGDERNRFIIPFAFGATAASSFSMFFLGASAASQELHHSNWSRAFMGIFMTLLYGIINYPYLACLNAEYKIIGYTMGLVYSLVRFIVDLFVYFGCVLVNEHQEKALKEMNIEYLLHERVLANMPVVICTLILIGSYSMLLYKEIKKLYVQDPPSIRYVLQKEEATAINLAGDAEKAHVNLLFSNQLPQAGRRAPNQNGTWYNSLKNRIYVTRPDFKFSTQFLSSFVVSCIFVYQLTVALLIEFSALRTMQKIHSKKETSLMDEALLMIIEYIITSVLIACLFTVIQLCFFMRSHRKDVLKTYRTRKGLVPEEILHPKMLVGKSLRFCGYQVAFVSIGLITNTFSAFFLLSPIFTFQLLSKLFTTEQIFSWIRDHINIFDILPFIVTPILVWISMTLLCHFVFRDRTYPDISITIDNRRLFGIMSYFFFFFNILVGLWSGLFRIVKGAILGLVFLPRIDRTTMMKGYRRFDRAYMAYIGFLSVLVAFKHPVMLCFCQFLLEGVRRRETGQTTVASRPRVSTRALNRWFLAVLLMRNPSLMRYRKQGVLPGPQLPVISDVQLEMPPIESKEDLPPAERLKLLDVY